MEKHRGMPSRLPGTDFQFTIRRTAKGTPPALRARDRYADRRPADRRADEGFLAALWELYGEAPFPRGNLDAGRLSWLFGREILPAEDPFDPESYDALLKIDVARVQVSFPGIIDGNGPEC